MSVRTKLYENDSVWARFYRDGKNLGEIAAELRCSIYDLSPWLASPVVNAAFEVSKEKADSLAAKDAEIARLREALESIRLYANDTLSGRADGGPDNRAWQREAVVECRNRARAALEEQADA